MKHNTYFLQQAHKSLVLKSLGRVRDVLTEQALSKSWHCQNWPDLVSMMRCSKCVQPHWNLEITSQGDQLHLHPAANFWLKSSQYAQQKIQQKRVLKSNYIYALEKIEHNEFLKSTQYAHRKNIRITIKKTVKPIICMVPNSYQCWDWKTPQK